MVTPPRAHEPASELSVAGVRVWTRSAVLAALAIAAVDAVLLQQKKSFFTGGFLTAVHTEGPGEALGFLLVSVIVDLAVLGVLAAVLLWASSRLTLTMAARVLLVAGGALTPLLIWDFVEYSLMTHLGDAFDLGLMFDLTGRSVSEILAVVSGHLLAPAAVTVGAASALAGLVWAVDRIGGAKRDRVCSSRRLLATAAAVAVAGLSVFVAASTTSDVAEDGLRRKPSGQVLTYLFAALTDFDRDGFGVAGRLRDPAPFNGRVYPYAIDAPGNGIDENAVGGDLPAGTPPYGEIDPPAAAWRSRPDVVLIVLESFRADALGRRVRGHVVTPELEALARDGVASGLAFSHNGYTTQSRFHLLTGSLTGQRRGSLIDDFAAQGYETAYFSAQDESFGGPDLSVGFERAAVRYDARQDRDRRYSTFTTAGSLAVSHATVRERIAQFLQARAPGRPLFLYVNFHDTHFPYDHREIERLVSDVRVSQREITPRHADAVREMYDNTARSVDHAVGATIDLVTTSTGRAPAVIVTADHGESLFDEGFLGHGYALNDAQTRIPLVVHGLALEIVEPFGQADLRNALVSALAAGTDAGARPTLRYDPRKAVFQYLGNIDRPRQIALATGVRRVIYDFRDGRLGAGSDGERVGLVQLWERMVTAKDAAERARQE